MLTYLLVWIVALGSFGIYLTAFFFPELHRKNDLIWSGVGLFYALVLWVYSDRIRGGFLLGQTAGVALLVWLGWQTWQLRRELTPADLKTPIPSDLKDKLTGLVATVQSKLGSTFATSASSPTAKVAATVEPASTPVAPSVPEAMANDEWDDAPAAPVKPIQPNQKAVEPTQLPQQAKDLMAKVDVSKLKTQATGLLDQAKAKLQDWGILSKPGTAKVSTPTVVKETIERVETVVTEVAEGAAVVEVVEVVETVVEEVVAEAPETQAVAPIVEAPPVEDVPELPVVTEPEVASVPQTADSAPADHDTVDSPEAPAPEVSVAPEAAIADNSLVEPSELQTLEPEIEAVNESEAVEPALEPEAPAENLTTNETETTTTIPNPEELTSVAHELMQSHEEDSQPTGTEDDPKAEDESWPPPDPTV
jgi:Ycf66 protein N-terminus